MTPPYLDLYCERTESGIWAEPLNALTNLAFLIAAALLAVMLLRRDERAARDSALWALIALVFLIGIGSALFHTTARRWAMIADVAPITLYIVAYSFLAFRRLLAFGVVASLFGAVVVLVLTGGIPALTAWRGGSYLPALAVLLGLGLRLGIGPGCDAGRALFGAGCLFAVSLGFRTIDGPLCPVFPVGTHFLWHLLNAGVLYVTTRALIRFSAASAGRAEMKPRG